MFFLLYAIGATTYYSAYFGQGTGPIFVNVLNCVGYESSLFQCRWTAFQNTYHCSHHEDAGVKCEGIHADFL